MPLPSTNIPGFTFTAKDGGLIATPTRPATDSVTVIGCALDGPQNKVVYTSRLKHVDDLFGPVVYDNKYIDPVAGSGSRKYSGNSLVRGVHEVFQGGCADIRCVRVGGTVADNTFAKAAASGTSAKVHFTSGGTIGSGGILSDHLTVQAPYAGRIYNLVCLSGSSGASTGSVVLTQGWKSPIVRTYYTSTTKTWAELAAEINGDMYNFSVLITPSGNIIDAPTHRFHGSVYINGGTDGTAVASEDYASNRHGLYSLMTQADTGTFVQLREYETDIFYMAAMAMDDRTATNDTTNSIACKLAEHCYLTTRDHYPTLAVVGIKPLTNTSYDGIANHVTNNLLNITNGYYDTGISGTIRSGYLMRYGFSYNDTDGPGIADTGKFISVVAGPDVAITHPDLGLYVGNPAGIYAGMISALSPEQAATYKKIPGMERMAWHFNQDQLDDLLGGVGIDYNTAHEGGGAYVCFMNLYNRGVVVASDVTAAQRESDYKSLQIIRIVHYAMSTIKDVAINYIGQPNHTEVLLALRQDVKKELDTMAELRMINGKENIGYTFEVSSEGFDPVLGIVNINLTLRPAFEIKYINVTVNVRQ